MSGKLAGRLGYDERMDGQMAKFCSTLINGKCLASGQEVFPTKRNMVNNKRLTLTGSHMQVARGNLFEVRKN